MNRNPSVKIRLTLGAWSLILAILTDVAAGALKCGHLDRSDRILLVAQLIMNALTRNRGVRRRLDQVRRERVQSRDDQVQELIGLAGGREGSLRADLFKIILVGFLIAGTGWVIVQFAVLLAGGRNG